MVFFAPVVGLRWTIACESRSLNRIVPSGRVTRPHTTSSSVPTWVTVQIGWVQPPPGVVTSSSALGSLSFLLPSTAVTTNWYLWLGVSALSEALGLLPLDAPIFVRGLVL